MERVLRRVSDLLALTGGASLLILMVAGAFDAVWRFIGGRPVAGVVDYGEILLVGITFLALAYAQRHEDHVLVDVLASRLPPRVAKASELVGLTVAVLVLLFAVYAASRSAVTSFVGGEHRFGLVRVPVWPGRVVLVLGILAWLAELLRRIVHLSAHIIGVDDRAADT